MSQPKILISESHPLAQQALVSVLKSLGHTNLHVALTNDIAEKLILEEKSFDILFFSLSSANCSALTLLRQANHTGAIRTVIFVTDVSADIYTALCNLAKFSGIRVAGRLGKKYTKSELQAALESASVRKTQSRPTLRSKMPPAKAVAAAALNDEFVPFFQPKLDLASMKIVGAEILMRWKHPKFGIIGPQTFIDLAKRFGHLDIMTFSIFQSALEFLNHEELDKNFKLSINIDATQLTRPDFSSKVLKILKANHVRPDAVILEITETGLLKSPAECYTNLIHLRTIGCGISIDDFGTGYSSLQRICEIPCTEIKLDMSFVKNIDLNKRTQLAVASMAHLSQQMGVSLVAEGIETVEQLKLLQSLNCQFGQGYIFSPPISGESLIQWMSSHKTEEQFLLL